MSDYWEGDVVIDYDSNTFSIERNGKAYAYDLDEAQDFLDQIYRDDPSAVVDRDGNMVSEYEVYGQEWGE